MKLILILTALTLTAGAAAAEMKYEANGLPLIRMDNNEVLNIEPAKRAGDPLIATIVVDGHQYAVYGLADYTSAGPVYAVKL